MLIGSLVELYVGLHSYLCFSPLEKLFWKAGSTPPRYLAICRASQAFFLTQSRHLLDTWWINRESSCLLDSSSTPGGSIKLLFLKLILCCSILARYLNCQRPLSRHLPWHLSIPQLSSITSISLDLSVPVHLPNTLSFTPNLFLKFSSCFFKFFYTW